MASRVRGGQRIQDPELGLLLHDDALPAHDDHVLRIRSRLSRRPAGSDKADLGVLRGSVGGKNAGSGDQGLRE